LAVDYEQDPEQAFDLRQLLRFESPWQARGRIAVEQLAVLDDNNDEDPVFLVI
jgi:hypothetical protein